VMSGMPFSMGNAVISAQPPKAPPDWEDSFSRPCHN
jgi:hypothetical protein